MRLPRKGKKLKTIQIVVHVKWSQNVGHQSPFSLSALLKRNVFLPMTTHDLHFTTILNGLKFPHGIFG
jgi:hypothetical protein